MINKEDILSGEPINGCLLLKVDLGQIKEDLGLSRDSQLILTEMQERSFAAASSKGVVVKIASDAYGEKYRERYGNDIRPPQIGDTVHFVPYQTRKMDKEGEYYLLKDEDVNFVQRRNQ